MPEISIRDAREDDIPAIIEICRAGAIVDGRYPPLDLSNPAYLAGFRAIASDANNRLVVAEADGEVVGTMQITITPGLIDEGRPRGTLENVHVRADQRGNGIGKIIVDYAIEECRKANCHLVQLTSNKLRTDAHRFYKRLGFEDTHAGFKLKL